MTTLTMTLPTILLTTLPMTRMKSIKKTKKICPKHTDIHPTSDIGQQPLANYSPRWNLFRRGQKYNKAQGKREVK